MGRYTSGITEYTNPPGSVKDDDTPGSIHLHGVNATIKLYVHGMVYGCDAAFNTGS